MAPWLRRHDRWVDPLIAVLVFWLTAAQAGSGGFGEYEDIATMGAEGLGFVLALLVALPLLWRRRAPFLVLSATLAPSLALVALGYAVFIHLGPAVALYSFAARLDRGSVWPVIATAAAGFAALVVIEVVVFPFTIEDYVLPGAIWAGAWLTGDRRRIARLRAAEERRLSVAEERARIARELHDSAGHAINTIRIQAGAARVLLERDPEGSREAIEAIEQVAAETAEDIDRIVGALRDDEPPALAPPPGVRGIPALVERLRAAGLAVELHDAGDASLPIPHTVERAAYRIAQETLTNAARHGAGSAEMTIERRSDALVLTVTNPVAGQPARRPRGGRGITGMRERAGLLGGTLEAAQENGRFGVRAVLPYDRPQ
jgi:signal transduction histidine kinase